MSKKIEVLIVTMNQNDHSLIQKMNIKTDALVGNQCDYNSIESFTDKNGNTIRYYSFEEQGVGINRNNLLLRTTADYVILADDDMVFNDNYPDEALNAFHNHPDADVLLFNLDDDGTRFKTKKDFRVRTYNCGRFGAARIGLKMDKIRKNAISFNQLFGGGCKYGSGEDTLFLKDCINKGLKLYAVNVTLARLEDSRKSTWFTGINDKWLYDTGASKAAFSSRTAYIQSILFLIKHHNIIKEYTFISAYQIMRKGIRDYLHE